MVNSKRINNCEFHFNLFWKMVYFFLKEINFITVFSGSNFDFLIFD